MSNGKNWHDHPDERDDQRGRGEKRPYQGRGYGRSAGGGHRDDPRDSRERQDRDRRSPREEFRESDPERDRDEQHRRHERRDTWHGPPAEDRSTESFTPSEVRTDVRTEEEAQVLDFIVKVVMPKGKNPYAMINWDLGGRKVTDREGRSRFFRDIIFGRLITQAIDNPNQIAAEGNYEVEFVNEGLRIMRINPHQRWFFGMDIAEIYVALSDSLKGSLGASKKPAPETKEVKK